jgi:parallel beta-helix repeat protein
MITNSNTRLDGENITLFLKDIANCPVIIIGNSEGEPVTNIDISRFVIDGNKDKQTKEHWKYLPNGVVNNNGIIVQNASGVRIHDINMRNCKSGGLVTTLNVNYLSVSNVTSENNAFDGIACYETRNSTFDHLQLINNNAAGISLDNNFNSNTFSDVIISNNNVGIFMRNSHNNTFTNITIRDCKLDLFMSQVNRNMASGCTGNIFEEFISNRNFMINYQTCTNNVFQF